MARFAFSLCTLAILLHSTSSDSCSSKAYCGCSNTARTAMEKIVGGVAASEQTWNWIVSFQSQNEHRCGAVLLSMEYAITAAHCVKVLLTFNDLSQLSILAGTKYLTGSSAKNGQRRAILSAYAHPQYNPDTFENDIAILHFAALSVSASSQLGYICLPTAYQDPFDINTEMVAIGWGVTVAGSSVVSNYLQQVNLNVFSSTSAECTNAKIANPATQFCASVKGGGKDTCQGDSGGPIVARVNNIWVLAGLTSAGVGCAQNGYAGLYTRVSPFIPLIERFSNFSILNSSSIAATPSPTTQNTTFLSTTRSANEGDRIYQSVLATMLLITFLFHYRSMQF